MGIRYMWLCQAGATSKKDLVMVCNGDQVCEVIQSSRRAKNDLLVVHNRCQVCGATRTYLWFVMGIRYVRLYQVAGRTRV